MKIVFTPEQIEKDLNKFEIEEDQLVFSGDWIEGEGKNYIISGTANIEGEVYRDFQIEVALTKELDYITAEAIMNSEWDWYDYKC